MNVDILVGDCRGWLRELPGNGIQCCVTSPPYYGLRDYDIGAQIGLEPTPEDYIVELVSVFREVRRVLADDGTLWLNLGDSYSNGGRKTRAPDKMSRARAMSVRPADGAKPKDLLMIPARVALALQADGWWLRSDIIWHKPNAMPESVGDRPTSCHEHVFLLTKSADYHYDAAAIKELVGDGGSRNARNVWSIPTIPYADAHFATMPADLAERCIRAGSRPEDTVLDPFGGAGTTAVAASRLGRNAVIIELNPAYTGIAARRVALDAGMFATVTIRPGETIAEE